MCGRNGGVDAAEVGTTSPVSAVPGEQSTSNGAVESDPVSQSPATVEQENVVMLRLSSYFSAVAVLGLSVWEGPVGSVIFVNENENENDRKTRK